MRWLVASFLVLVAACLDRAPGKVDSPRCYDVRLAPWDLLEGPDSLMYTVPPRILLDSTTISTYRDGFQEVHIRRLAVPVGGLPTPHRIAGWSRIAPDSLHLYWTTGMVGVAADVAVTRKGFEGVARQLDEGGDDHLLRTPIHGAHVSCTAPLKYRLEDQHQLSDAMPLSRGDSLSLGAYVTEGDGWDRAESPSMYAGHPQLRAPYEDPLVVELETAGLNGPIRRIEARYDAPRRYEQIRDDLVRRNGEATYKWSQRQIEGFRWANRTTGISLSRRQNGVVVLEFEDYRVR
jgi:hypothetical protein